MKKLKLKTNKWVLITITSAITLLAWATPATFKQTIIENEFLLVLKQKFMAYNHLAKEERVYLHFDKPMYEPGDNIWLSAYIRDAQSMKPSQKSDIVHVELINPKGTIESTIHLITKDGIAAGDFALSDEAVGGIYKIKAYTNWMKNFGDSAFFTKEIQVQEVILPNLKMKLEFEKKAFGAGDEVIAKLMLNTNENKPLGNFNIKYIAQLNGEILATQNSVTDEEGIKFIKFNLPKKLKTNDGLLNVMIDYNGNTESISNSIPIVLNTLKMTMYPEGGDLVTNLESKVAFKVVNEFDKPADVEGLVLNNEGKVVTTFTSYHQGMGAFKLTPNAGERYHIKITKPANIIETFEVPTALPRGYVMGVSSTANEVLVLSINSTETEKLTMVSQVRGKLYYSSEINAKQGNNAVSFETANFPIGVNQITLFDSKGIARAERLVFVNKYKQLNISIKTDKQKYLPRELVKMTLNVTDERGMPMPANVSMAVTNDQLIAFANDKSGNILSQLLLQQELNEKIEEPAFYFDNKEKKADLALDYLLMTSGWRKFKWEKIINDELPSFAFAGEKAIIAGIIKDGQTGKIIPNASIKIDNGAVYQTDENGKYIFNKLDLAQPVSLEYIADGFVAQKQIITDYNQNLSTNLYKPYTLETVMLNEDAVKYTPRAANINAMQFFAAPALADGQVALGAFQINEAKAPRIHKENREVAEKEKNIPAIAEAKNDKALVLQNKPAGNARLKAKKNAMDMEEKDFNQKMQAPQVTYYRARAFAQPHYDTKEIVTTRTDFRNTIYWNPNITIDRTGVAQIQFYASDDITSFRTIVEGISTDGTIGRNETNFYTQLPFVLSTKIPVEVVTGDLLTLPVVLKNNTNQSLGGSFQITTSEGLKLMQTINEVQTMMPNEAKTILLKYEVLNMIGEATVTITFKSCGLGDSFSQNIKIVGKGYPAQLAFAGKEMEKEYKFELNDVVDGSLTASLTAFPNVVSDLMKGVEGILREPSGCFEQTSMSSYPNVMVLDYLKSTDTKDDKTIGKATALLDKGYDRLITFESKDKGYEWFGANPGHEALTAYGLMQFNDMKKVGKTIDNKMMERTAQWLMDKKDGKGGFTRNALALDNFGRAKKEITDAYIVYALSEGGFTDIKKEFEASYQYAVSNKDNYVVALMACAAFNLNEKIKGENLNKILLSQQQKEGNWLGTEHSITYSQGKSLIIETTSLAILALLKTDNNSDLAINNGVQYIVASRDGSGTFGNTQGTVLALKALTTYAKMSKKTNENGTLVIYIDGKKVAEKSYIAGEKEAIVINNLAPFLTANGHHTAKIKYVGATNALPYSLAINWNTTLPLRATECVVDLKTTLSATSMHVGETVRLTAQLSNKKNEGIATTIAIIGIPAGLSVQPWQLKELQEKKVFDYYEITGNKLVLYYRCMAPNLIKEINFDLKAEVPGNYHAPASSAYLYYTNEYKTWCAAESITIKGK